MNRHKSMHTPQDVEDQLLLAIDTLMDIEPGWDDEDEEIGVGDDGDAKTRRTGQTGSSKHSKAHTKKSGMTAKSKVGKKSLAGKSKISKASQRSKSMRSQNSRASKKTTTALSKRQEEDAQPMYLNCSHFDKLVRIHSVLAMFASDSTKQREYALDAHFFICKMWE